VTRTGHFALELSKLAFSMKTPPILTSSLGKTTKGVVAKPLTAPKMPSIKTPGLKMSKSVPTSGKIKGIKLDPARANTPPPPVRGGTNVQ